MNSNKKCVVALGTFDGMHPGHVAVINACVSRAHSLGCKSAVYTFYENPRSVFAEKPLTLMSYEARRDAMLSLGIDFVVFEHFDAKLAETPARDFIKALRAGMNACCMVIGEDYTFGAKAEGNARLLAELGAEMGFEVITVKTVMIKTRLGDSSEKVSSSRIRRAIIENKPEIARALKNGDPID